MLNGLPGIFGDAAGLLLAVLGFGAIIIIHELGHFLAARWAGIRVYSFAVGFGPAAVSWRRGIGLRRGSTNRETLRVLRSRLVDGDAQAPASLERADHLWPAGVGKTEYRLNWLPFGGYVQMRGQDDVSPGEASQDTATDSFTAKPVWKRMVVISAGVVMNVLLAAVLYVAVYTAGKPASPAVIGGVQSGSPAESAVALNAGALGVTEPGLRAGDEIERVGGSTPREFNDVWLAGALADPDVGLDLTVRREGVAEPLRFRMVPVRPAGADFASVGLLPAVSTWVARVDEGVSADAMNHRWVREEAGIPAEAVRLISIGGRRVEVLPPSGPLFGEAGAAGVGATFEDGAGRGFGATLTGLPVLEQALVLPGEREVYAQHVAGFVPPMQIGAVQDAAKYGLRPGDVIARIDRVEWPGPAEGIRTIREAAGREIEIDVVRDGTRVMVTAQVGLSGTVGFYPTQALRGLGGAVVTRALPVSDAAGRVARDAALPPGSVIESVNGAAIDGYAGLRGALVSAGPGEAVTLGVRLPMGDGARTEVVIDLTAEEHERLVALGWRAPELFAALFVPEMVTLKASNPAEAVVMGVVDTHQMILRTYLTLVRLFEGSVEVDQLRGPVGIAHIGTQVAQRSFVELLFFFAVISANLAVLNFLPIPIADGGLMVFLIIEWIRGKPVPAAVQNASALLGLLVLGAVFLLVTFNDITRLL